MRGTPFSLRKRFQLTLPERGATPSCCATASSSLSFNSHSPSGERLPRAAHYPIGRGFNSHSPSGERPCTTSSARSIGVVSTHTPRAGSDKLSGDKPAYTMPFQLTLPERGATDVRLFLNNVLLFQLTLPERGATKKHTRN